MLGHRLRRWPNIKTTSVQRLVFAGLAMIPDTADLINLRSITMQHYGPQKS